MQEQDSHRLDVTHEEQPLDAGQPAGHIQDDGRSGSKETEAVAINWHSQASLILSKAPAMCTTPANRSSVVIFTPTKL